MQIMRYSPPALVLLLVSTGLSGFGHARLTPSSHVEPPEKSIPERRDLYTIPESSPQQRVNDSRRGKGRRSATQPKKHRKTPALEINDDGESRRQHWSSEGDYVQEPPAIVHIDPKDVDLCARESSEEYEIGAVCGMPPSEPCFDRSRCTSLSVYVYDQECSLADSKDQLNRNHNHDDAQHQSSYWRDALSDAGMLAETYEEACLFIHVNTHNHDEPCATRAPLWNGGANHIMMEFTPWWPYVSGRPRMANTYAMDWAFDHHTCHYRSGYDLSLPLMPKILFPHLAAVPATERKYFITFKGALYIGGFGIEERAVASRFDDPEHGVVSVVKCFELHNEHLYPENKDYCAAAKRRYDAYDYEDLMNTTFALVPAGRSPGTFRLGEVMSAGSIPVFIVRDWVKPYQEQLDWDSFSFTFSPDDSVDEIMDVLLAVGPEQLKDMQLKSLEAYREIFAGAADYSVIARTTVAEIIWKFQGVDLR